MWQLLFWASVGVILYCYIGYPFLLFLASRLRKRRLPQPPGTGTPSVCVLISAFNEEKVLREKIENTLSLRYPADKLTILVASDGSTDRTVSIVDEFAPYGVKLFHRPTRRGKSAVINDVIREIEEEIVVFTDANALFQPDAVETLAARFSDPSIGCAVGRLSYVDRDSSSVGKGEGAYWRYESIISRLESRLGSVLVANGSIFAVRRELFRDLFPAVANDFQIPFDVAAQGKGVVYEPRAQALEHSTFFWREEFQRKVRIILRGLTGFSLLRSRIRGFRLWQLWSHKILRWTVGFFLLILLGANVALAPGSAPYTVLLVAQAALYLTAIVGWRYRRTGKPRRFLYIPFYFAAVNGAAVVGILKFLGGQRQRVWEKAESTRLTPVLPLEKSAQPAEPLASNESLHGVEAQRIAKN